MKKITFVTVLLIALMAANNTFAQGFGVKGSFNMFNMTITDDEDDKTDTGMIPTFDAGVFAEFEVAPEFFLRPELLYAGKGTKLTDSEADPKPKMKLSYVELPILFLYKGGLGNSKVLLGFGPYLAYGIGGKYTWGENHSYDVKFKGDVKSTDNAEETLYMAPLDFGAKIMAGFELAAGLQVALDASLGLANITPKYDGEKSDSSIKNVGFGLTLGYRFGK